MSYLVREVQPGDTWYTLRLATHIGHTNVECETPTHKGMRIPAGYLQTFTAANPPLVVAVYATCGTCNDNMQATKR